MFRPLVTFPFAQQHHTTVHAYSPPAAVTSSRPLVTFAQQTTVWKTGSNGLESTVRLLVWISLGLSTTTVWCGVVSVGREMVGCGSALLPHWNQIGAVSVWILAHYQVYFQPSKNWMNGTLPMLYLHFFTISSQNPTIRTWSLHRQSICFFFLSLRCTFHHSY